MASGATGTRGLLERGLSDAEPAASAVSDRLRPPGMAVVSGDTAARSSQAEHLGTPARGCDRQLDDHYHGPVAENQYHSRVDPSSGSIDNWVASVSDDLRYVFLAHIDSTTLQSGESGKWRLYALSRARSADPLTSFSYRVTASRRPSVRISGADSAIASFTPVQRIPIEEVLADPGATAAIEKLFSSEIAKTARRRGIASVFVDAYACSERHFKTSTDNDGSGLTEITTEIRFNGIRSLSMHNLLRVLSDGTPSSEDRGVEKGGRRDTEDSLSGAVKLEPNENLSIEERAELLRGVEPLLTRIQSLLDEDAWGPLASLKVRRDYEWLRGELYENEEDPDLASSFGIALRLISADQATRPAEEGDELLSTILAASGLAIDRPGDPGPVLAAADALADSVAQKVDAGDLLGLTATEWVAAQFSWYSYVARHTAARAVDLTIDSVKEVAAVSVIGIKLGVAEGPATGIAVVFGFFVAMWRERSAESPT